MTHNFSEKKEVLANKIIKPQKGLFIINVF